ncbi:hypothetical protein RB195_017681 [Necator americanus]|uniref:Uncharacterized protein n=1 Tax=Necator americanus TaxID=51031 RepID=A0ABR1C8M6_NECAM
MNKKDQCIAITNELSLYQDLCRCGTWWSAALTSLANEGDEALSEDKSLMALNFPGSDGGDNAETKKLKNRRTSTRRFLVISIIVKIRLFTSSILNSLKRIFAEALHVGFSLLAHNVQKIVFNEDSKEKKILHKSWNEEMTVCIKEGIKVYREHQRHITVTLHEQKLRKILKVLPCVRQDCKEIIHRTKLASIRACENEVVKVLPTTTRTSSFEKVQLWSGLKMDKS